jgi:hypothetical protein
MHHVFRAKPGWISFIAFIGLIVSIAWCVGLSAGALTCKQPDRRYGVLKRIFQAWLAIFPIALFAQQFLKFRAYTDEVWDLGIISHAFSATRRGYFFQNIFAGSDTPMSAFSQHTEPIFIGLYPFFALIPHPLTLVAIQSIAMAAATYFFFRLARTVLKNDSSAIVLSMCFSVYPAFYYCGLLDVHGDVFAVPFVILMMHATLKKRKVQSVLFLLIALSCKEYVALTGFSWGLYCLFALNDKRSGFALCLLSAGWLFGALYLQELLRPQTIPSLFSVYYGSQPGGPALGSLPWMLGLLRRIFRAENMHNCFFLFVPTLFYCLRYPWVFVFLSLPLLKDAPVGLSIESHRLAPVLPLLWYSVLKALHPSAPQTPKSASTIIALLVAAFLSSAIFSEAPWSQRFIRHWQSRYRFSARAAALDDIVKAIPQEVPASASAAIYPHLINRRYLYLFPVLGKSEPARYAVIEKKKTSPQELGIADSLRVSGQWVVEKENEYGLLLKRR